MPNFSSIETPGCWFVQQQHLRIGDHGHGDIQQLPHALAERAGDLVAVRQNGELLHQPLGLGLQLRAVRRVQHRRAAFVKIASATSRFSSTVMVMKT